MTHDDGSDSAAPPSPADPRASLPAPTTVPAKPRELVFATLATGDRAAASRQFWRLRAGRPAWRELFAALALVILADLTLWRGQGFAGLAALTCAIPIVLWLGRGAGRTRWSALVLAVLLELLALRLVWMGTELAVLCGAGLVFAFGVALVGRQPDLLDVALHPWFALVSGLRGLYDHAQHSPRVGRLSPKAGWWGVVLPAAAVLAFGGLFVLANPNLRDPLAAWLQSLIDAVTTWFQHFDWTPGEGFFWLFAACGTLGLLRPYLPRRGLMDSLWRVLPVPAEPRVASDAWYAACRNTLAAVVVLFAVYLVFEFKTLWLREFTPPFSFQKYAHEGAAWLTVALALATAVLSLVFRGPLHRHPRVGTLRRLAGLWSLENLALAVAVYHRLNIYMGYNGLTRLRVVGMCGITLVVIGFLLMIWKIVRNRDFLWLVRRDLWALALMVVVYALLPVDAIVHTYNVRRIMNGDFAPAVAIVAHPVSAEGYLVLPPLLECDNAEIRHGITAMLAQRLLEAREEIENESRLGWTAYQCSEPVVVKRLEAALDDVTIETDPVARQEAIERFRRYAWQWY